MIVADTNVISYFYLPTSFSESVSRVYEIEPEWVAPALWRSEFCNVLALYLRKNLLTLPQAIKIQEEAESLLSEQEYEVSSTHVLALIASSHCSSYDCEFVALAKQLNCWLVTEDKKILTEFPTFALSIADFLAKKP